MLLCVDFNPRTPLQSAIINMIKLLSLSIHFNPRTPLQSAMIAKATFWLTTTFQSTHSITECDNELLEEA